VLGNHFDDTRFCAPCHATHAQPGVATNGMWAAPTADASLPADNEKCLGCHSKTSGVKSITPTVHPPVALQNIELNAVDASLPLFNQQGKPDPNAPKPSTLAWMSVLPRRRRSMVSRGGRRSPCGLAARAGPRCRSGGSAP
jgi:hypothetical protein